MKIIVNNKREQAIMNRLIEYLDDYGIELMEQEDDKFSAKELEYRYLQAHEYDFIRNGIAYANIEVDSSISEMTVPHYQFTGICHVCSTATEGTIDGNELDIIEYERLMNSQSLKCEGCMTNWSEENES